MADLGSSIKGIWMKGMEAIGNTASNIASSTKSRVDEMNLVNRRAEILKDFGNQAYALWQKGERFPEVLSNQLQELARLDEQLNDLRAERLAGVKPEAVEEAPQEEAPEAPEAENNEEPETVPVITVEQPEEESEPASDLSSAINDLFEQVPTAEEAAGKVNEVLDSLEEGLKSFADSVDEKLEELSEKTGLGE